ncbi:DUF1800 domain-containing protein [Microlunatus speluncae]|uniref:DUF1800 domain-containing protein n=1 Tax=Microlunatus speluncae TaxID=2594267 RepID=UPI0012660CC4|nr:DUF1800 domain-containing protein [Microlunatus speluncae]
MARMTEDQAIRRLLDRYGFGAGGTELADARRAGWRASLSTLLSPESDDSSATPPPELAPYQRGGKDEDPAAKKERKQRQRADRTAATIWWLDRMVATDAPLVERLTWFWHGHFATSLQKVKDPRLMLTQNTSLRRLGRGDFRDLARSMIIDPAMLIWLDGNDNTAKAANENLAREFLELFTLGHGHYSEDDIKGAARALTGWKLNRKTGIAKLSPRQHATGDKTILGRTADFDAKGFVDQVVAQPACPRFLVSRLWFRLVNAEPPPDEAVDRLVGAYGPDRDFTALLGALAEEDAFADSTTTLVKQPVEWAVGLLRAAGVRPSKLEPKQQQKLITLLKGMGQLPFLPPSVGGWAAGSAWLSTAAARSRIELAAMINKAADAELTEADPAAVLGLDRVSDRTAASIESAPAESRLAVAACSPEYVVSL